MTWLNIICFSKILITIFLISKSFYNIITLYKNVLFGNLLLLHQIQLAWMKRSVIYKGFEIHIVIYHGFWNDLISLFLCLFTNNTIFTKSKLQYFSLKDNIHNKGPLFLLSLYSFSIQVNWENSHFGIQMFCR